jgi:bacterioferritin-associated ferredoxin
MIVCICNNVSDKAIRKAVDKGVRTLSALREQLEVGTCCGKCNSCAKTILRECLEDQASQTVMFQPAFAAA